MKKTVFSGVRNKGFYIFFTGVIIIFLGRLITMRDSFLLGDSLTQFYPWLKIYSESLKSFQFPFWTRYMHSGFPLMAEGQIGGFYPVNVIFFLLLPFKIAYNYSIIFHFILAGLATYFYARKIGADEWGGGLSALLFCFGSAYAGCFYNIVTLKTLALFPMVLLLIEKYIDASRFSFILSAGIVCGCQFLAGFQQMAAYSFIFYIIYMLYLFKLNATPLRKAAASFIIFAISTILIALPQITITYGLIQKSDRLSQTLGFALWKSFPPVCILGLIFPRWLSFFYADFYIGIFSILFLIYAIMNMRTEARIRPLLLIGIIAVLAALGRYNPIYTIFLKVTKFYGFRNPSKFLFFALFAISVLAGFGFSKFFKSVNEKLVKASASLFMWLMGSSLVLFFAGKFVLSAFKEEIISFAQSYVAKNIYGKPHHRYDLQSYLDKVRSLYETFEKGTDLSDIFVAVSLVLVVLGLVAGIMIIRRPGRARVFKLAFFSLIFLDIYAYSFYGEGFRGNIEPFLSFQPTHRRVLKILKSDKELFRITPFNLRDDDMPWWSRPNSNILVGIDSIAAYTPLAEKGYRDRLSSLEVVDNSLGIITPSGEGLKDKYQLLKLLNVKYIVSADNLTYNFLEGAGSEDGIFLYRLNDYLPRVFFTDKIEGVITAGGRKVDLIDYRDGLMDAEIEDGNDGYLVFSENYYPGWEAFIDGAKADILPVEDIVQAVKVTRGRHRVIFRFRPKFV